MGAAPCGPARRAPRFTAVPHLRVRPLQRGLLTPVPPVRARRPVQPLPAVAPAARRGAAGTGSASSLRLGPVPGPVVAGATAAGVVIATGAGHALEQSVILRFCAFFKVAFYTWKKIQ